MEKTKRFKISFNMSISQLDDYSYGNNLVSTSITNDVPKGEDPELFLRKRLREELNRMMRGIEEIDFEIKDEVI